MIYFASDIHLGAGTLKEQREQEQRFVLWLERARQDASAIYLLGDIFDFWFEYKRVVPQGFVRTLGKLAELSDSGIKIVMITGNHDMWIGDYLKRECGVELHTKPLTEELYGRRLFLAHGDNMKVRRGSLLWLMNTIFRSKVLRWMFSWFIHPDIAIRFGRWWSGKSRKSHSKTPLSDKLTEPLKSYAEEYYTKNRDIDYFIFGHMHIAVNRLDHTPQIIHLGAWDKGVSYATLSPDGELKLHNK